jgi:phage baseplate assembly protein W
MKKQYVSIRFPVAINAALREVSQEPDYGRYIEQLMKQVLLTSPGERINRPDFGCGLRQMIFAPLADVTETLTKITVLESLERWLGDLIAVDNVGVKATDESLMVSITYRILARQERRYLNVEVAL